MVQQYYNKQQMMQKQSKCIRQQTAQQFAKILRQNHNSECFQCGMNCNQWVQIRHAIFLCLKCANRCGGLARVSNIKSASLDRWTAEDLNRLKLGGNAQFREYLSQYDLQDTPPETYLNSKAAEFYRLYLLNPSKLQLKDAPSRDIGSLVQGNRTDSSGIVSGELLEQARQRLTSAAEVTLYYGNRAYQTLHGTLENVEVKQNAMKAVGKATETAHNIWRFMASKLEMQSDKENIAV